jgi:aspartyl-tRNA(Asn)/glutamyl-tRNA(Gln) amidotransferase subunit A
MTEGAALHADRIRARPHDFDPDVRDRLLAGALLPADWAIAAQKLRRAYQATARALFETVDIILAPATPCVAPRGDEKTFVLDGVELPIRPNMGVFTQPISFIGLPVVSVPVWLEGSALPIGVQIIAAPWADHAALAVARHLEAMGVVKSPVAG